jgi:hypothetical protein
MIHNRLQTVEIDTNEQAVRSNPLQVLQNVSSLTSSEREGTRNIFAYLGKKRLTERAQKY